MVPAIFFGTFHNVYSEYLYGTNQSGALGNVWLLLQAQEEKKNDVMKFNSDAC